jgi:hypothetical protein
MKTTGPRTTCPDCEGTLQPIQLLDYSGRYQTPRPPEYRTEDAHQNFWTGRWTGAGRVAALACSACGRILLYAVPDAET